MARFVITLSRMCGSGGSTVGRILADKLGVNLYGRNLLRLASDDSGISEELFACADEKLKSTALFKASRKVYNGELIPPESGNFTSDRNLFNYQAKVLLELADRESYVVIGRCADYVLKDRPDIIRVFITSDDKSCIAHEAERNDITKKEAWTLVEKLNRERADYYHYYTGQSWSYAGNYDLCINSAGITYEQCAQTIIEYLNRRLSSDLNG